MSEFDTSHLEIFGAETDLNPKNHRPLSAPSPNDVKRKNQIRETTSASTAQFTYERRKAAYEERQRIWREQRMSSQAAALPSREALSGKNKTILLLLCWYMGGLGLHRLYAGKINTGIAMLLLFLLPPLFLPTPSPFAVASCFWALSDFVAICRDRFADGEDKRVKGPADAMTLIWFLAFPTVLLFFIAYNYYV
ncbi:MAG: TM2 domain-containing protein [Deltaproteobacteria bacterium]|nr:TM2 domain-containing protein [Deltaproteobacteria bacterium]